MANISVMSKFLKVVGVVSAGFRRLPMHFLDSRILFWCRVAYDGETTLAPIHHIKLSLHLVHSHRNFVLFGTSLKKQITSILEHFGVSVSKAMHN